MAALCACRFPGLPVEGARQPVHIKIEFDASVVDLMIDRLKVLRAQMKPPPPGAGKLKLASRNQLLRSG